MYRVFIAFLFLLISTLAQAQQPIVIERSDMPNVNDTFRYSITDNLLGLIDLDEVGEDLEWNYSTLGSFDQRLDTLVDPVLGTPLVYNVTFSNIFDLDYFATLAGRNVFGQFNQNFVSIENVYDFYRETNNFFANVGLGLTINGFPLTAKMEPRDKIYEFPLEYGDQGASFAQYGVDVPQFGHFGQKIERNNTVDAWGTITTRFGTFDALRVTTILNVTDTFSLQGFGFEQDRPTEFEIKWLAKNIGAPVLAVRGQVLFGQQVVNTVEYLDSIRGFTLSTFPPEPEDTTGNPIDTTSTGIQDILTPNDVKVRPNPFKDDFTLSLNLSKPATLQLHIMDKMGRTVVEFKPKAFSAGSQLWNSDLSGTELKAGIYHLIITDSSGWPTTKRIVRIE